MSAHAPYFEALDRALKAAGIYSPVLVLDLNRVDRNIETLLGHLPAGMGYRIVAKSLPIPNLLSHIRDKAGTDKLMTFNVLMLKALSQDMPDAEQLLGKPVPAAAFRDVLASASREEMSKIHWLIDTTERLLAYGQIAEATDLPVNVVLELDVGLHRGGFTPSNDLREALQTLKSHKTMNFTGFMGYEPHLASVPTWLGWRNRAIRNVRTAYEQSLAMATEVFGQAYISDILRNIAGSPTYRLYDDTSLGNEVSVGSALVKPTDFDTDLLEDYVPACFIATPVLKAVGATQLPALEFADGLRRITSPRTSQSFFIHGGKWMADPVSPPNLTYNKIFGRSSNQEMMNGPSGLSLKPDDFMFFRPHQSEAVFLHFGDVLIVRQGKIVDHWPTFSVSA